MYAFRTDLGPVELAFTDRHGGVSGIPFASLNLAFGSPDPLDDDPADCATNLALVMHDFAPDTEVADLSQVHGRDVVVAQPGAARPRADGIVSDRSDVTLLVRAADCVPVLLADPTSGVIGAAHAGRQGMALGVVPETVAALRRLGAEDLHAWIGPHVCGACYEVPAELRDEVAAVVPQAHATTSWGTPSVDLGAGIRAQLAVEGVQVHDSGAADRCTRESSDLYSYRRDGRASGRLAGLVRLRR